MPTLAPRWMLVPLAAALLIPATASATITPMRSDADAFTLAKSISVNPATVNAATTRFSTIAPPYDDGTGTIVTPNPVGLSTTPLGSFPLFGSPDYAILSTGDATVAGTPGADGMDDNGFVVVPGRGPSAHDAVTFNVGLNVPANTNCLVVRFRFLSEEYPVYVGSKYNDAFMAELDTSDWTTAEDSNAISSPHNFAFDEKGNPVTINAAGAATVTADNAAGTEYGGATRRLAAVTAITPGAHTLYLSVFDQGDQILDSAVFVDGLDLLNVDPSKCSGATFFDDAPPTVTTGGVTGPEALVSEGQSTQDDTPTFGGKASTTINDDTTITGAIYSGTLSRAAQVAGTPVQSKTVPVANDGTWTLTADTLPQGSYTFQATQGSKNGPTISDPLHFTIDKTAPALGFGAIGFAGKTRDTTPLLSGTTSDAGGLTVSLFAGKTATGAPLQAVSTTAAAGTWSAQLAQLKPGTYTAVVQQGDKAGNVGTSKATFLLTTSNPIGKVKLAKKLSSAKAAKGLKGSLKFAFPGKVTYTLTAKIGKKTQKVGAAKKTLALPGKAAFAIKPKKGVANAIKSGSGALVLKIGFVDDQGRKYSKTQKVPFK